MNIKNKVIIITGASMGIGKAAAELLSSKGAKVALAARSAEKLENISKDLPDSFVIQTDMTDEKSIENMIRKTKEHYGRIDILINNAGQAAYGAIEKVDVNDYRKIIELNIVGVMIAMQKIIPIMREQGGGMILNISSQVSKNYFPFLGAYASTKYALNAISLTARKELEKDKIVVSVVHPGLTATDFGKNAILPKDGSSRQRDPNRPMPQADSPEKVASVIADAIESEAAETVV